MNTYNELKTKLAEDVEDVRNIELSRIDELLDSVWDKATVGGDLTAMDRVVKLMERRAKILGYEKTKVDLTSDDMPVAFTLKLDGANQEEQAS